jgi:hypothetical protein
MTQSAAAATDYSKMTRKQLAEILADSDVKLGVYGAGERDRSVTVWMRDTKSRMLHAVALRGARGRL